MSASDLDPRLRPILGLAEEAVARPGTEVDLETLQEIFAEAAMLLDLGNVLEGLDEHDAREVVDGLCQDLLAEDPAQSIRDHAESVLDGASSHDPEGVAVAYRMAAHALRL
ncbi:hypothetical protein [Nocardioides panzhihuensis]|uniref:Uncharacterized protein n=1 Tax=Nocardioides panzhihuensis TaxID=860243 RepID=A0A7Z0DNB0_9ACTN|nr:hypothetical protein [Nocardioides panzhihuensis]NYI78632.1 hypothetical protein [Nocardioides panzhihuensis]